MVPTSFLGGHLGKWPLMASCRKKLWDELPRHTGHVCKKLPVNFLVRAEFLTARPPARATARPPDRPLARLW